ncbi:retrovirus-related pol polyprotein from transposon TNT 1-94 [Tanacetum coccineum]
MASNPENVRLTVLMKLQEAIDEEAILEEQILALMHRFADRFTDRRVEINNLMVLHDHPLVDYGKYALGCMTGADMKKCVYLKSVRDELLRSMEEKRQLMANYRDILKFEKDHLCSACQLGKSKKFSLWPKSKNTNMEVLHTLHMDLCGPMRVQSIKGKKYILVIVDEYSRFTWVKFLRLKDETPEFVTNFLKQIQVGLNKTVRFIRTDNGTEFVNQVMSKYYEGVGIFHQKSVPRTPQQNGVVERRNRTLVEAARTMMIFSKALMFLWAEAIATACVGKIDCNRLNTDSITVKSGSYS